MKNYYKEYLDKEDGFPEWTANEPQEDLLEYIRYLPSGIQYKYLVCLQVNTCRQFITLFEHPDFNIKTS